MHVGMGTLHAWEKYGDGAKPDIQAVAKGLGGGYWKFSEICKTAALTKRTGMRQ